MSNKVERDDSKREKFGSAEDETDAAHKLGYEVLNEAQKNKPGPKGVDQEAVNEDMNRDDNIRIKTKDGNRIKDHRNDEEIGSKLINDEGLSKEAGERAVQAFKGTKDAKTCEVQRAHKQVGNLQVENGKPGPNPKVENLADC